MCNLKISCLFAFQKYKRKTKTIIMPAIRPNIDLQNNDVAELCYKCSEPFPENKIENPQ